MLCDNVTFFAELLNNLSHTFAYMSKHLFLIKFSVDIDSSKRDDHIYAICKDKYSKNREEESVWNPCGLIT